MIDPIINLVFSIQSNKGVYALLLGSGVSRSSGIPTGWEIVIDLIEKMAEQIGESCQPDPAAWFKSKYGKFPDYSKLLKELAKTPSERNNLLKAYFEPTFEEKENGLKLPTQTHRSIAKLIDKGFIKIVITTNFDRLLEQALAEVGVMPIVISTPDAVEGALPITHSSCFIIKVHGDYLDTRIKNTPKELEKFDKRINALLDRIFDEFGLIICGWSSEWDEALRASIERCKSRRFTTFWAARGKPNDSAKKLIDLRGAQILDIKDADSFFSELSEKVFSLEEISRPHPLSAKLAVETTKRYLKNEQSIIRLNDFVLQETEKVYDQIVSVSYPPGGLDGKGMLNLLNQFNAIIEILQSMIIVGCYWGSELQHDIWIKCFERIANIKGPIGSDGRFKPKLYPAILLLYSGGIASIVSNNFGTLYEMHIPLDSGRRFRAKPATHSD